MMWFWKKYWVGISNSYFLVCIRKLVFIIKS